MVGTLVMATKSVTFRRHDHLVSVLLEICSAIPTTLHFQCFCILYKYVDHLKYNGIKEPRLNVHTNQILAHTFSHATLDFVVS